MSILSAHRILLSLLFLAAMQRTLLAWGPHTEIAQAALDALGPDDPLMRILGSDAKKLCEYVWMADWRGQLLVRPDEVFYSDDYLLFPAAPRHYQHICPEVQETYSPFFRRALQALRTESSRNAARWTGSLLHFTTDTGSPPHALGILGPVHSKMENWVDARLIHIPGYEPQLLGADDATAEAGFIKRMEGLIAFSKLRAELCRANVEADHRALVEPIVLESALETARVTADLLHTLGILARNAIGTATLKGRVVAPKLDHEILSRLPAKVILKGTLFSTLTSDHGTFEFRNLPPAAYELIVSTPGCVSQPRSVNLNTGAPIVTLDDLDLSKPADGNLVRNCTFGLRWVSPNLFDHWSQPKGPARTLGKSPPRDWEGEWIPLSDGVAYRLHIEWKSPASDAIVFVRTKAKVVYEAVASESQALASGMAALRLTGTKEAAWAQICVRTPSKPDDSIASISLQREQ